MRQPKRGPSLLDHLACLLSCDEAPEDRCGVLLAHRGATGDRLRHERLCTPVRPARCGRNGDSRQIDDDVVAETFTECER